MTFPRRRRRLHWRPILLVVLVLVVAGIAAVQLNVMGAGTKVANLVRKIELFIDPPPDRPIDEAVLVTPRPTELALASGAPTTSASRAPGQSPTASPKPTPAPVRAPVDVNILADPESSFISEQDNDLCAVAGTQMVLAIHGKAPLTNAFQRELAGRIGEWESRRDSKNGGWGPSAMVLALKAYGVPGYQVRAYETRSDALADAARAIETTGAPVMLLAWKGAHTWVMTGFRADADPLMFDDAKVSGAYILDPWYPRVSEIWPKSDPPGTFQNRASLALNYFVWERPEGLYLSRDGLFIAVVPTKPLNP
jgi:hypothetical protein